MLFFLLFLIFIIISAFIIIWTRFKEMTQIENLKKSNFANLGLYAMKLAKMGPP